MRVLMNLLVTSGRKTGIGHYASELLRSLQALNPDDQYGSFPPGWIRWGRNLAGRFRSLLTQEKTNASETSPSKNSFLMNSLRRYGQFLIEGQFQRLCRKQAFDLYHEPNYIPLPTDLPTVATIPDLSILLHPEWHPKDRVVHYEQHFSKALDQCDHFLAISEFCRQEILSTFSLPAEKVTSTYLGVRPGLSVLPPETLPEALETLGLPPRYLLYLGTIEPRKNLLTVLRAYCSLPEQLRARWPFVLVGSWGWNTGEIRDYFHNEARHRGVLHLGYIPDDQLPVVYNGARALVYPSYYEGFGLPPIEMMACGGAVLASPAGAVQEIVGSRAHLIPPDDQDGWREALQRIVEDEDWWLALREGVTEIARPYTWEQCARSTREVYQKILGTSEQKQAA